MKRIEKKEMGCYAGARTRYTFKSVNKKGESLIVELGHCNAVDSTPANIWKKNKWIDKNLTSWINIDTYVTDIDNNCYGKYNPQISKDFKSIVFDWIIEDTAKNRDKILNRISKDFFEGGVQ